MKPPTGIPLQIKTFWNEERKKKYPFDDWLDNLTECLRNSCEILGRSNIRRVQLDERTEAIVADKKTIDSLWEESVLLCELNSLLEKSGESPDTCLRLLYELILLAEVRLELNKVFGTSLSRLN